MNAPITVFSTKAENYACYRWDYAQEAIQAIFEIAGLSAQSTVADLGAGTGILTRHFAGVVGRLYAIEPNSAMRSWARQALEGRNGYVLLGGCAEAIPLSAESVDLVAVAQAIHWFDPVPARPEIWRVLKPGGWLALLRNYCKDAALNQAIETISTPEYGVITNDPPPDPGNKPLDFYFNQYKYRLLTFPFTLYQDWHAFFGSLLSTAKMPGEHHPRFPALKVAAYGVFEHLSVDGRLEVAGETELVIGKVG